MNNYIDAGILRKEIEKRFWDYGAPLHDDEVTAKVDEILSFIDSLQQEQPALSDNIDEVAKQLYPIITEEAKSDEWKIANREHNDMCIKLQDAFGKGAELMARQMKQKQSEKSIEINGIRYKEVPAKTDDKICKECDYFLDNGSCNFDDCPCTCADNILERIQQEQPEVDIEKEIVEHAENMPHGEFTHESECIEHEKWARAEFRHFYELGLNARKED